MTPAAPVAFEHHHGRLLYRRRDGGDVRGREDWALTLNRDGSRTMRCLAITDDSAFVRDVTYTIDHARQPVDAFVRVQVLGRVIGAGYFRTDGDTLRLTADSPAAGRVEQVVPSAGPLHIITHAVMLDGWTFWHYDTNGPADQSLTCYNTSTRWNGTDGPVGRIEQLQVSLIGAEPVTVPAGTFECKHYVLSSDIVKSPPSHLYVTGDHNILVRYDWEGLGLEYVLEHWTKGQP